MSDNIINVPPNFADPIIERLEWMTDVLPGFDTTEQRVRLRRNPRRSFQYSFAMHGLDAQRLRLKLHQMAGNDLWMPDWTDPRRLTADVNTGDFVLPLDDVTAILGERSNAAGIIVQSWIILWRSINDYQTYSVDSTDVGAGIVTLNDFVTGGPWKTSDTIVYIIHRGLLLTPVRFDEHSTDVVSGSLSFSCHVDGDFDWPWDVALDQYKGIDVWHDPPNRRETLSADWSRDFSVIDNDTGVFAAFDRSGLERIRERCTWTLTDQAAIRRFRGFVFRRIGKLNPFWAIFYTQDMTPYADLTAFFGEIDIVPIGYQLPSDLADPLNAFVLVTTAGERFYLTITSVDNAPVLWQDIRFIPVIEKDIPIGQVKMLSFLHGARITHDRIEIAHIAPGIAEAQLTFATEKILEVYNGYAEVPLGYEFDGTGGSVVVPDDNDDGFFLQPLPFTFPIYERSFDQVYICTNGYLYFDPADGPLADATLDDFYVAPVVMPLSTDLIMNAMYVDSSPSVVRIRWDGVDFNNGLGVIFECRLFPNGDIKFDYGPHAGNLDSGSPGSVGVGSGDFRNVLKTAYDGLVLFNNLDSILIQRT
jgi:hypothetical protein